MSITTKFPATCSACNRPIPVGTTVEWDQRSKTVRHRGKCPAQTTAAPKPPKTPPLLSSGPVRTPQAARLTDEQAAAILARDGRQFVRTLPDPPTIGLGYEIEIDGKPLKIGTAGDYVGMITDWDLKRSHAISLIDGSVLETFDGPDFMKSRIQKWSRLLGAPRKMESPSKHGPELGTVNGDEHGRYWMVIAVDRPYHMSADDCEDMDMFDRRAGWATPYEEREVTESAPDRQAREAREAKAQAAAAEVKRRKDHFTALRTPPEGWVFVDGAALPFTAALGTESLSEVPLTIPDKATWTLIDQESEADGVKQYARLYQAGEFRVLDHGNFDDWRTALLIPPHLVDAYFGAEAARRAITPEAAAKWLEKYRGCVGSQLYEWVAGHAA